MAERELYSELAKYGLAGQRIAKHLRMTDIRTWDDITPYTIEDFKDKCREALAPNTVRLYCTQFSSFLDRYAWAHKFGSTTDYRKILKSKGVASVKTYLTQDELKRFEKVIIKNRNEALVHHIFLISAYTGMRLSDAQCVTTANVQDGMLTYVSKKTGVEASIPVSQRIMDYIQDIKGEPMMYRAENNKILQRLCKRAGINKEVKVYHGGNGASGPKWMFVSSHTARVSFCTNLSALGVSLVDIARLAGHTNTAMTERYIVRTDVKLPNKAMAYLKQS